jgi:hypothetical protein
VVFYFVVDPDLEAEGPLVGIKDLALTVRKNPMLFPPINVQKISCGNGLMLLAEKAEAGNVFEKEPANGTLLISPDLPLHWGSFKKEFYV